LFAYPFVPFYDLIRISYWIAGDPPFFFWYGPFSGNFLVILCVTTSATSSPLSSSPFFFMIYPLNGLSFFPAFCIFHACFFVFLTNDLSWLPLFGIVTFFPPFFFSFYILVNSLICLQLDSSFLLPLLAYGSFCIFDRSRPYLVLSYTALPFNFILQLQHIPASLPLTSSAVFSASRYSFRHRFFFLDHHFRL